MSQLLCLLKELPRALEQQREAQWISTRPAMLEGRTVAVLGTGPVGWEVVRLLSAFGATAVGVTRRSRPLPGLAEVFVLTEVRQALSRCEDVIVAQKALKSPGAVALRCHRPGGSCPCSWHTADLADFGYSIALSASVALRAYVGLLDGRYGSFVADSACAAYNAGNPPEANAMEMMRPVGLEMFDALEARADSIRI